MISVPSEKWTPPPLVAWVAELTGSEGLSLVEQEEFTETQLALLCPWIMGVKRFARTVDQDGLSLNALSASSSISF